jgi:hypothetical protein
MLPGTLLPKYKHLQVNYSFCKIKSLLCMGAIPIAEKTGNGVSEVVICYIANNF